MRQNSDDTTYVTATPETGRADDRLLYLVGPVIGAGAATAAVALVAGALGWQSEFMFPTAAWCGSVVLVISIALTWRLSVERRAARRAFANVSARVGAIVDSAMDAILSIDDQQRIVLVNASAERVFGWSRDELLGKPIEMLIPQRHRHAHRDQISRFGMTGTTTRRMGDKTVLNGIRKSGEEFPIEASISHLVEDGHALYTVILRDITTRVRAEEALTASENRLRAVLESAMDAIITVDESQTIVFFNAAAERIFHCERTNALGSRLDRFLPARFREAHAGQIRNFGETGSSSRRMGGQAVVLALRTNGEEFPVESSISQVTSASGRLFSVILRDITDRLRAERELQRSREELRELASVSHNVREQEKSRIARELHDELAQALTALKMDVAWLSERLPEDGAYRPKLQSMQNLLDTTVAATRRISADLRPLLLDDLGFAAAVEWLASNFSQRSGIPCEFAANMGDINLPDPQATAVFRMLQECLTNIARHAKATQVEINLERDEKEIAVSVQDDGVGFDTSAPRKSQSFGLLGLRERANLLDGRVIITSNLGQGTLVDIRVPIKPADHA